ncbi:murein biosynthesis integral membrane protein MurJ [Tissierellaceae bacterium BX21]|jgi:putative peptidoglycan lipid II flippase|uniref:Lipid II flippase n=1 Tax=Paratissierella segnis TaxID=2763679 RepID=A0A926EZ15_9FIRM|nr:murein biosynthesis integral membrane protein MurJ [Paratissierella segnis]
MVTLNKIKKSVLSIVSYGIIARVLTFFKGILLAYYIGSNYEMDSYLVAFSLTMLLTKIISEGLTISLVPKLQESHRKEGLDGRNRLANNMINSFSLLSLTLILIGFIIAPLAIKAHGPGLVGEEFLRGVKLFRIGIFIVTFEFIRAILLGYLQSLHRFKAGPKSGVANPLIYIIYLVALSKYFGLEGLMIAGIIAIIAQIYIVYKACLKDGYKYKFYIALRDKQFTGTLTFLLPVMINIVINEIILTVNKTMGSVLEKGTIAQLNYANDIITLIVGIFIAAFVIAIYPILAENYDDNEYKNLKQTINDSLKIIALIAISVAIILITLSVPIVRLFYERGDFGYDATIITAGFLRYYAIGIIGTSMILLLIRIFYAIRDLKSPIIFGIMSLVMNVILNYLLIKIIGAKGIALGTSLSVIITAIYGICSLNFKLKFILWKDMFMKLCKYILAGIIMALIITIIYTLLSGVFGNTLIGNLVLILISALPGIAIFGRIIWRIERQ